MPRTKHWIREQLTEFGELVKAGYWEEGPDPSAKPPAPLTEFLTDFYKAEAAAQTRGDSVRADNIQKATNPRG